MRGKRPCSASGRPPGCASRPAPSRCCTCGQRRLLPPERWEGVNTAAGMEGQHGSRAWHSAPRRMLDGRCVGQLAGVREGGGGRRLPMVSSGAGCVWLRGTRILRVALPRALGPAALTGWSVPRAGQAGLPCGDEVTGAVARRWALVVVPGGRRLAAVGG